MKVVIHQTRLIFFDKFMLKNRESKTCDSQANYVRASRTMKISASLHSFWKIIIKSFVSSRVVDLKSI